MCPFGWSVYKIRTIIFFGSILGSLYSRKRIHMKYFRYNIRCVYYNVGPALVRTIPPKEFLDPELKLFEESQLNCYGISI